MNPSLRFDRIQEDGMEKGDILFPWFDSGVNRDASQGIHDLCNINVIRASNTTRITGRADPDGF